MFNLLKQLHNQKGAHIIILGLIFPACLMVMAVLLDTALFYTSRAAMQNVVDAAAIAGAKELPSDINQVKAAVEFYIPATDGKSTADRNYIDGAIRTTELSNDGENFGSTGSKYCRVTLTAPANSIFMKNILPQTATITVQAVAIKDRAGYAIFADDGKITGLDKALRLSCNSVVINGNIHSNNGIVMQINDTILNGDITAWNYGDSLTTSVPDRIPLPGLTEKRAQAVKDGTFVKVSYGDPITKAGTSSKPMFYEDAGTDVRGMYVPIKASNPYYATFYSPNNTIDFSGTAFTLHGTVIAKSINFQLSGNLTIHAPNDTTKALVRLVR